MRLNESYGVPFAGEDVITVNAEDCHSAYEVEKFLLEITTCQTHLLQSAEHLENVLESIHNAVEGEGIPKGHVTRVCDATILNLLGTIIFNALIDLQEDSMDKVKIRDLELKVGHVALQMMKRHGMASLSKSKEKNKP